MKDELKKAIQATAAKTANASSADEALKYSQASQNSAHALMTVVSAELAEKDKQPE